MQSWVVLASAAKRTTFHIHRKRRAKLRPGATSVEGPWGIIACEPKARYEAQHSVKPYNRAYSLARNTTEWLPAQHVGPQSALAIPKSCPDAFASPYLPGSGQTQKNNSFELHVSDPRASIHILHRSTQ